MKSTAASLTLALLGTVAVSGCHQAAQRASSIASSLPVPSRQIEDYETRLSIARQDERKGKTKAAKKAYEKLVTDNPTNPLVYHRLGIIAAASGDFDTANGNFRRAYELAPENAELLADWGYSLYLQGEFVEAEELTRLGAELAPYDSRIANNLNLIYQNSPLSPPVGPQMVQLMPDDGQGVIVAEALDETVAGSELEWLRAGYEESLHPFENVTLPEPASEAETVAGLLPEASPEDLSATVEPTALETAPTIPETAASDFASVEQPAKLPSLNEPIAIAAAESASFDETSIAPEHVRKLLTRARLELAAGDVEMSHAFAEAAAEIAIPLQVYQERPEKVLDEIEFVTGHKSVMSLENPALAMAEFSQPVPPAPVEYQEATTSNASATSIWDEAAANDLQGFRAIGRTSLSITPKLVDNDGERRLLPERRAYKKLSQVPVVQHTVGYSRDWTPLSYSWEAPQLKYNPLYFEDPQLERYGNEVCILQPFLSGARFYTTIATLPYQMMSEGNSVCHTVYDFGYARPGDCVPYALEVPEFSLTGSLSSGAWVYALIVILP
ncbi:MAG: tetratricopeptide (TPR) repeat protein [Planctomycetaceae bacterium]|jgi:tetratricopeptide (TPR) repeat protein